jgi:hypothetical protein
VQATIEKSRIGLNREEGELQFRCAAATYSKFWGCVLALRNYRLYFAGPF